VGDLIQAGHVQGKVEARGNVADLNFAAAADGDDGEIFAECEADNFGGFFSGRRFDRGPRGEFVDGVAIENRDIRFDPARVDDRSEAIAKICCGGGHLARRNRRLRVC
jgi:hypothetical protein